MKIRNLSHATTLDLLSLNPLEYDIEIDTLRNSRTSDLISWFDRKRASKSKSKTKQLGFQFNGTTIVFPTELRKPGRTRKNPPKPKVEEIDWLAVLKEHGVDENLAIIAAGIANKKHRGRPKGSKNKAKL
jgi:hypothetical protein